MSKDIDALAKNISTQLAKVIGDIVRINEISREHFDEDTERENLISSSKKDAEDNLERIVQSLLQRKDDQPAPLKQAETLKVPVSPDSPSNAPEAIDYKIAQGQNRTTKTKWADVLPYIKFRYQRALESLPASGTVFEMGCGIGVGLNYLAESRPDLNFVGLDNSKEALDFGRYHFSNTKNLKLVHTPDFQAVAETIDEESFLVALEVIEHLDNDQLEFFKRQIMQKVDEAVFSFPYNEQNIEGTNHLQSIDIYTIFEIFPGFRTLFLRKGSIKFIGHWKRQKLEYVVEKIGVRGEVTAIERLANW